MNALEILKEKQNWAVIGVTPKHDKYGYKVYKKLCDLKKTVYPVSPVYPDIEGNPTYPNLSSINQNIDVVVFIVNKKFGQSYLEEMKKLNLPIAWMQPGTYDEAFLDSFAEANIQTICDCVLIQSGYLNG